jgi:CheY-like chemotaxis protein
MRSTPLSHVHILLVDDNKMGLTARQSVLEEQGYRITVSTSADEAMELFRQNDIKLVVTDYRMPKINGIDLIRRLREERKDLPVVLLSGYVDPLGLNEDTTGADAVIQKSAHEIPNLLRAVNRLLRRQTLKKSAARQAAPRTKARRAGG